MRRYSDGSSFLCSLCSVSEVSEGLRRRHELHGGTLETFTYQHPPQPTGSCGKLAHPCNCQQIFNLVHRVRVQKSFQTPNPCDCWHFLDCEVLKMTIVTEIPYHEEGGGRERQTPDHISVCICVYMYICSATVG